MQSIVLEGQQWLNSTYGLEPGYITVSETGYPGTAMSLALISALQIELGITEPTGTFGPLTTQLCDLAPLDINSVGNQTKIIQYGLHAKGYNPGAVDGIFGLLTQTAIQMLLDDTNIPEAERYTYCNGRNTNAILGVAEYKGVSSNYYDSIIREIQQSLNYNYYNYTGISPCDGVYQKSTCTALIYALQAEEGLSPSIANGNFGPTTTANLPTITESSNENAKFVLIIQYALYAYFCYHSEKIQFPFGFTGRMDAETIAALNRFQTFCGNTVTNIIDKDTWMSLLISTGNPERIVNAGDVSALMLTDSHAETLLNTGCSTIGRYLTGVVINGNNVISKCLSHAEIENLLTNQINIFPIFQDARDFFLENLNESSLLNYFTFEQGLTDAKKATIAAMEFGIPAGCYIYFAVDYDFNESQTLSKILPYFEAIQDYSINHAFPYRVGIYASRNTCSIICNKGYAASSFVSDLSTGYSGNAGYPLPENWSYDQIQEISNISCSSGYFDLDRNLTPHTKPAFTSFSDITIFAEDQKNLSSLQFAEICALQMLLQQYLYLDHDAKIKLPFADYEKAAAIYEAIRGIYREALLKDPDNKYLQEAVNFNFTIFPTYKTTKVEIENATYFTTATIKLAQLSESIFNGLVSLLPAGSTLVLLMEIAKNYEVNQCVSINNSQNITTPESIKDAYVDWANGQLISVLKEEAISTLSEIQKKATNALFFGIECALSVLNCWRDHQIDTENYIIRDGLQLTVGDSSFQIKLQYDLGCEQTVYQVFCKNGLPILIECTANCIRSDVRTDGYINESAIQAKILDWLNDGYIANQIHNDRNPTFASDIWGTSNYSDVSFNSPYYEYLQFVANHDLMDGYSSDVFNPTGYVTKIQFCNSIFKLINPTITATSSSFNDVSATDAVAVLWAYENNLIESENSEIFGINNSLTREDIALSLYKLAQLENLNLNTYGSLCSYFSDANQVSSSHTEAVLWAINNLVFPSLDMDVLSPKYATTREECAKAITKFAKNILA